MECCMLDRMDYVVMHEGRHIEDVVVHFNTVKALY